MKETYSQILKSLIQIPSPSGHEKKLADFIIENYLMEGWVVERDAMHNILFRPEDDNKTEKLPLLYAHLDTYINREKGYPTEADMKKLPDEDIIWLDEESGEVHKKHEIQMGFDDKAGVAAILYLMKHTKLRFRALLVAQEETSDRKHIYERKGGIGIEYALRRSFTWVFRKSEYVLSLDRRNGNEIITTYGDGRNERPSLSLCSDDFANWVENCSSRAGHLMIKSESENIADVYNIRFIYRNLNCVNLSIGYYDEHKPTEYLTIDETLGVIRVVMKCLESDARFF